MDYTDETSVNFGYLRKILLARKNRANFENVALFALSAVKQV